MKRAATASRSDAGFSLIELLVVILIIAAIANIALPNLVHARMRARAAAVVADFNLVRAAAVDFYSKNSHWPADTGAAMEPSGLTPFLEGRVLWSHSTFDYKWENWAAPDGTPTHAGTGVLIGFSVRSDDPDLLVMIEQAWGNTLARRADGVTFSIVPVGR
jgi:prepilin-type N-terminal cleavage/methylation domain-containing protein